ncbi:hypothetical protein IWQ61_008818 [Dispira simplex]|nr:hypothetical protein IWQ61_008818 [Dispira simplex]
MAYQYSSNYYTPDILAERLDQLSVSTNLSHSQAVSFPSSPEDGYTHASYSPESPSPIGDYNIRRRRNGMCDVNDSVRTFFATRS